MSARFKIMYDDASTGFSWLIYDSKHPTKNGVALVATRELARTFARLLNAPLHYPANELTFNLREVHQVNERLYNGPLCDVIEGEFVIVESKRA